MTPSLTVVTLAVRDLERALRFYRDGLGWPTEGVVGREIEHGAVAFFELAGGLRIALWPRASLAHDTGLPEAVDGAPPAVSLGHNVATRDAVDAALARALAAGATEVRGARDAAWGGRTACLRDPDGHLWEIVWNPALAPIG